jgi:hypothetical protein
MVDGLFVVLLPLIVIGGSIAGFILLRMLSLTGERPLPRHMKENQLAYEAERLLDEIEAVVKQSSTPSAARQSLTHQSREVCDHIASALWKLYHLRRVRQLAEHHYTSANIRQAALEAKEMEDRLLIEINRSLEVLFCIPVSLMRVDQAHRDHVADRLIADLGEANQRLREVAATYSEMRQYSYNTNSAR